jgi:hypothetical protein
MGKLTGLGRAFASSMLKGSRRAEALRKRKIEKELMEHLGYSRSKAKKMVSEMDNHK